jgi:CBS-domain-containing membrane protein
VFACKPGDDLKRAEALMRENEVRRLPVVDDNGRIQGILSLNDIAREAQRERAAGKPGDVSDVQVAETLADVCHPRREHRAVATAA